MPERTIKRIWTRYYRDNKQCKAYVEWSDGARTEGKAHKVGKQYLPCHVHMIALFERGLEQGLHCKHETW